jgi:LysR family transcriptional regulator, low CO2-responsive transcriptional regulator
MSITFLRAFHAVAQAGSFSAASRAGAASQPTLSAEVRVLETRYGARLFDRRGRRVALTPLGQSLLGVTARLFVVEQEAWDLLAGARTLTRGHLRVAADSPAHVMPHLARMCRRHAGLGFSITIGNSSEVIRRVLEQEAEIGVTARRTSDPRLFSRPLSTDRLVLFVPRAHPWRRRRAMPMARLADAEIVLRERGSVTREVFETRLAEQGVRPRRLLEVETREAVREAVLAGFGVGVVFESEIRGDREIHPLAVSGADLTVQEFVIALEQRRQLPPVRAFFEAVEAEGAGQAEAAPPDDGLSA